MIITHATRELQEELLKKGFSGDVPACMQLVFGGTSDSLWVDIKVVRKSDGLPLVEIGRVHGINPGTTVTLEDITRAFNVTLSTT